MSYATVSGEVAIRNHGTSVVPYVDALIAALDKYYTECDLYEILLYVQRLIENQKIPIGSNGQFMKGKFQDIATGSWPEAKPEVPSILSSEASNPYTLIFGTVTESISGKNDAYFIWHMRPYMICQYEGRYATLKNYAIFWTVTERDFWKKS